MKCLLDYFLHYRVPKYVILIHSWMELVHVCWLKQQTINTQHTHFYLVAKHILFFFQISPETLYRSAHVTLKDVVALTKKKKHTRKHFTIAESAD